MLSVPPRFTGFGRLGIIGDSSALSMKKDLPSASDAGLSFGFGVGSVVDSLAMGLLPLLSTCMTGGCPVDTDELPIVVIFKPAGDGAVREQASERVISLKSSGSFAS